MVRASRSLAGSIPVKVTRYLTALHPRPARRARRARAGAHGRPSSRRCARPDWSDISAVEDATAKALLTLVDDRLVIRRALQGLPGRTALTPFSDLALKPARLRGGPWAAP